MTKLILLLFCGSVAFGQFATTASVTPAYPGLAGLIDSKPTWTSQSGPPSGSCTPWKEMNVNSTVLAISYCPASGVWAAWPTSVVATSASLYSGAYTSGITATGTTGQTCAIAIIGGGGSGATVTVALTGTNAIAGATALVVTAAGTGFTSAPTTGTVTAGTASACSGTPVLATVLTVPDPGGSPAYLVNTTTSPMTFLLPAGVPGLQRCYRNGTGKSGVLTVAVSASNAIDLNGSNGTTSTGTLVSPGMLGDSACLFSDATNHWYAYGYWTNN